MRSTPLHSFSRQVSRLALLALIVVPAACGDDDPAEPTPVASENLVAPANAATIQAVTGQTFAIPNAGAAIAPAFAGQSVDLTFNESAAPTATIVVGGTTIQTDVSFGSCIFTVTGVTGLNAAGLTNGQRIIVNPCNFIVNTLGAPAGTTASQRNVQVTFGTSTSTPIRSTVTIGSDGTIVITKPNGSQVTVGTVTTVSGT